MALVIRRTCENVLRNNNVLVVCSVGVLRPDLGIEITVPVAAEVSLDNIGVHSDKIIDLLGCTCAGVSAKAAVVIAVCGATCCIVDTDSIHRRIGSVSCDD